jgi:hypothetical protein
MLPEPTPSKRKGVGAAPTAANPRNLQNFALSCSWQYARFLITLQALFAPQLVGLVIATGALGVALAQGWLP